MDWNKFAQTTTLSIPGRLSVDIERLILEGTIEAGVRLPPERELAALFNVSRSSVRDALRELEIRGLVDRKPGRGTVVLDPSEDPTADRKTFSVFTALDPELREIMELRLIVEPPIARLTAGRSTPRDIAQLRELVEAMEDRVSAAQYVKLDRAFHQAIAQYTHNPLLASLNEQITQQIDPSRARRFQTKARRAASSAAHRRIFEAIASGNGDRAEQEAREHVLSITREISRTSSSSTDLAHRSV